MNCLIIDDEPLARRIIKNYCENLPFLKIEKECSSALEAITFLNENCVDLLFLDINMPKLQGLDFLKTLNNPPLIIITTAYQEFAIESFELNVLDYLLKPFSFERFLKAVNKAQSQKKLIQSAQSNQTQEKQQDPIPLAEEPDTIFIKGDKKTHQIKLDEILFLESYGSYVKIHLKDEIIITYERLTNFEKTLPIALFIRVHRSYIVSVKKIHSIQGNQIKINKVSIPVGNVYKHNLNNILHK